MANYANKILYGFSNIHIAKMTEEGYDAPVALLGAKSIEVSIETASKNVYADNTTAHTFVLPTSGEGTLQVLGLTAEERRMLAGLDDLEVGFGVNDNPNKPRFAVTFEQDVADGSKMLYVVYNVTFDTSSISLETTEEEVTEKPVDIAMVVNKGDNGWFYYAINSAESEDIAKNWHTAIQEPSKKVGE